MEAHAPTPKHPLLERLLTVVLVVVIGLNLWYFFVREHTSPSDGPKIQAGDAAPNFALPKLSAEGKAGARMSLEQHKGKVVLLDFWGTYCGPCKQQMPALQRIYDDLPRDQFEILSINIDGSPPPERLREVHAFIQRGGYTFPVVLDDGTASYEYQVARIPTLVLIGPDGKVSYRHTGLSAEQDLKARVQKLLPPG
jgi:thiol-disulfide isomerase/thioredoxin